MRIPRFRIRTLMIAVAVVGLGLYVLSATAPIALWVGGFPLQVDLRDSAGRTIVAVAAAPCQRRADAELFLAHPDSPEFNLVDVPWVEGQPFTVWIVCTGRASGGRELAYHQREALVMRVEYADGSTKFVAAAIPDGRAQRRVSVLIP